MKKFRSKTKKSNAGNSSQDQIEQISQEQSSQYSETEKTQGTDFVDSPKQKKLEDIPEKTSTIENEQSVNSKNLQKSTSGIKTPNQKDKKQANSDNEIDNDDDIMLDKRARTEMFSGKKKDPKQKQEKIDFLKQNRKIKKLHDIQSDGSEEDAPRINDDVIELQKAVTELGYTLVHTKDVQKMKKKAIREKIEKGLKFDLKKEKKDHDDIKKIALEKANDEIIKEEIKEEEEKKSKMSQTTKIWGKRLFEYLQDEDVEFQTKYEDLSEKVVENKYKAGIDAATYQKCFTLVAKQWKWMTLKKVLAFLPGIIATYQNSLRAKLINFTVKGELTEFPNIAAKYMLIQFFNMFQSRVEEFIEQKIRSNVNKEFTSKLLKILLLADTDFMKQHSDIGSYLEEGLGDQIVNLASGEKQTQFIKRSFNIVPEFLRLYKQNAYMALVCAAFVPLRVLNTFMYDRHYNSVRREERIESKRYRKAHKNQQSLGTVMSHLNLVKSFGSEHFVYNQQMEIMEYEKSRENQPFFDRWVLPMYTRQFENFEFLMINYLGINQVIKKEMEVGDMDAYRGLVWQIQDFFEDFKNTYYGQQEISADKIKEAFEIMEYKPPHDFDEGIHKDIKGKIEFKNITFQYPGSGVNTIDDLTLTINVGENVAFSGESGCGKSTLMKLIEGEFKLNKGQIIIDDVDFYDYNLPHLKQQMGYVRQEPDLWNMNIRDNICYAIGREVSQKELDNYCKKANCYEFINDKEKMPQAYKTKWDLSGGQKQRIAIARALIREPSILLLDEATSALDNKAEREVQKAINKMVEDHKGNLTIIQIAHRLDTIKKCDKIFYFEKGKVVEIGTYKSLMEKKEKFYKMATKQEKDENEGGNEEKKE